MESVRFFCMLVMVSLTCLPLLKPTFFSRSRAKVFNFNSPYSDYEDIELTVADLVTYCQRRGMPYTTFENWSTILSSTKDILSGKVTAGDVAAKASLGL